MRALQDGSTPRTLLSVCALLVGCLCWAPVVRAAPVARTSPPRRPAELSIGERIEHRLEVLRKALAASQESAAGEVPYSIDGETDPEALLPTELFGLLVSNGSSADSRFREGFRTFIQQDSAVELDWFELWALVDEFGIEMDSQFSRRRDLVLELEKNSDAGAAKRLAAEIDRLEREECMQRVALLREAGMRVGKRRLYDLLYSALAPAMGIGGTVPDDLDAEARRLAWIASGCR